MSYSLLLLLQAVSQVNEVFKDLADIVADQQQEIDAVESMIEKSHQHARSGLKHVEKANDSQEAGCLIS
jgi:t-SNARE complex subunit (syntaxin)